MGPSLDEEFLQELRPVNPMESQDVLETFITEVGEHLQAIENVLLVLEENPESTDDLNSLFRSFHTIKGTSEMFGFRHISEFTHTAETTLVRVRSGETPITPGLIEVLLKCRDHIATLMDISEDAFLRRIDLQGYGKELQESLVREAGAAPSPAAPAAVTPVPPKITAPEASVTEKRPSDWQITLRLKEDVFIHGLDPLPIIRYLKNLGTIRKIVTLYDSIPSAENYNPEKSYLGFEIDFHGTVSRKDIEENFEFLSDDAEIRIEGISAVVPSPPPEAKEAMEEIPKEVQPTEGMRIGKKGVAASKNLRVDSERIDHLINLVGELVMSGAQINQIATVEKNTSLAESAYHLGRIISEIRESTLRLRMVPVGGVFTRFNRVVHDLSRNLGKEVMLITMGDETELDKTVIEQISDPLMHLIRNSVDHGIEETATRIEHGKSPTGTITLKAYNEAGDIIIEVVDDGAGLDVEQIHKKAIQNELISPSQSLSKKEIMNLIFEPGLSTAKIVTSISGRGVGLDVVKKNITALNGSVEVESEVGTGTRFRIKLPLTLATIDGFLIRVADTKYVVPLDTIKECIEFERKEDDSGRRNFLNLRGEILPFINLKELFLRAGKGSIATEREYIAVVQQSGKKAGLLVDELLGEMQSVIKPLSVIFGKINGLSGITILGSGEVAFILDVHSLIDLARSREESRFS